MEKAAIAVSDYDGALGALNRLAPADEHREELKMLVLTYGYVMYGSGDSPYREMSPEIAEALLSRFGGFLTRQPRA